MRLSMRKAGPVRIFDVAGEIDFANSPVLRSSLLNEIQQHPNIGVLVNLSEVPYIDSSGIVPRSPESRATRRGL